MEHPRRGHQSLHDDDETEALLGQTEVDEVPFSWFEYTIICLLGMATLWAWNMFLAAAPYFASRFAQDESISAYFQSTILAVSTVTNLATMLVLSHMQSSASYPLRINAALAINTVVFALLAASTTVALDASPARYLAFLLLMVACASLASGMLQNGGYAFVAGFGRPEYMQAMIAGQGISGVLPAVAQVATVIMYPPSSSESKSASTSTSRVDGSDGMTSALVYFATAVVISAATLLAMTPLFRRHGALVLQRQQQQQQMTVSARKPVSLWHLLKKLRWPAAGVVMVFAPTMFFPVFTSKIVSVRDHGVAGFVGFLLQPFAFIPLAFLCWNLGDLTGRVLPLRRSSLRRRPLALFLLAVARVAQLPLYLLCNIRGRGAVVSSDLFYLVAVQFMFGLTNGWLYSSIMMASGDCVDEGEREAAGGFMALCLVTGLSLGSLLSFAASTV